MGLPISKHKSHKTNGLDVSQSTLPQNSDSLKNVPVIAKFAWTPSKSEEEHSQIHIKVGERLVAFSKSKDGYWTDVKSLVSGKRGWVPSNYIQYLDKSHDLEREKYYHGALERSYAEYLLNSGITGSYLLRDSEGSPGHYTISLRFEGEIIHYRIQYDEVKEKYYLSDYAYFSSVPELIRYHGNAKGSLKTLLLYPVNKFDPDSTNEYDISNEDVWEIARTEIIMKHRLGSGQYGVVYEALWKTMNCNVAVKTIKEGITVREEFLEEARLMKTLRHPNLVQLLGVCTREPPYYIITEFMANGNLLDFLRASFSSGQPLSPLRLLKMSINVVHGMRYLEEHNFIHRDLAARNCLVGEQNFVVKVADFGLARCISREEDTYKAKEGAQFPIKWTAPEGLLYNTFSTKSDVWAFGVLLWELATHGHVPYPDVHLNEVLGILEQGRRLNCPVGCPKSIYKLMQECWQWNPEDRPSFKSLSQQLESIESSDHLLSQIELIDDLPIDEMSLHDLPNPCDDFIEDHSGRKRFSSSEHIINCDPFDISPPILPLALDQSTDEQVLMMNHRSNCLAESHELIRSEHAPHTALAYGQEEKREDFTNSLGRGGHLLPKFAPLPPKRTTPLRQNILTTPNQEASSQEDIITESNRMLRPNLMTSSFVVQSSKKSEDQLSNISAKSNLTTPPISLPPAPEPPTSNASSFVRYGAGEKGLNRPISMVLPKNFRQELKQKLDQKSNKANASTNETLATRHFTSKSLDDSDKMSYTLPVRKRDSAVVNGKEPREVQVDEAKVETPKAQEKSFDQISSPSSFNSSLSSNNSFNLPSRHLKKNNVGKRNSWSIPSCNFGSGHEVCKPNDISNCSSGFISKTSTNSSSPNFSCYSNSLSGINNSNNVGNNSSSNSSNPAPVTQTSHYTSSRLPTLQSLSNNRLDKISDTTSTLPPHAVVQLLRSLTAHINHIIRSDSISSNHDQLTLLSDRVDEARIACLALIDSADCKAHAKFQFRDQCTKLSTYLPLTTKTSYADILTVFDSLSKNISKIFSIRNNNHTSENDGIT